MADDKKIDEKLVRLAHQITGGKVSPKEAQEMLDRAKENVRKLEECATPHDFQPIDGNRFQCSLCQGVTSSQAAVWYKKGLEHGRSSSN
jgi:hypothetical protein